MLIFVQSKERAKQLYSELAYDRVNVDVIHSDMPQQARNKAITRFRTGETWVLIATDLLGRGLDFLGLNTVLNYDFPQVMISLVLLGIEWCGVHSSYWTNRSCGS